VTPWRRRDAALSDSFFRSDADAAFSDSFPRSDADAVHPPTYPDVPPLPSIFQKYKT